MSRSRSVLRSVAYISIPAGGGALAWYNYHKLKELVTSGSFSSGRNIEVPLRIRGPDGKAMSTKKMFPRLSNEEVDRRIREHALGQVTRRPGGMVWRYQTGYLAANDGIEDAHAQALVERDITPNAPPGDLLFFAVMDGHGGPHTSKLLSKTLIPAVGFEMSSLIKSISPLPLKGTETFAYLKSFIPPSLRLGKSYEFDADPTYVSAAIRAAFAKLDSRIVNAPINLLEHLEKQKEGEAKPYEHPLAKPSFETAVSGSCALLAMLDTSRRDLYVACTGDSRAVAGYWEQPKDGSPGSWRAEVLTEDQTGRNPNELKRMQSEHPADEVSTVIQRGRVLGGLEPSRAFGDSRYKWSRDMGEKLAHTLLPPNTAYRIAPKDLKTPPYVTADPVVTHRKLSFLPDLSKSSSQKPTEPDSDSKLKFVVLATDGLWDQLSSSDVVALVGGHLAGLRGPAVPKSSVSVRETASAAGIEGKDSLKRQKKKANGAIEDPKWAFLDENIGSHLIRNALGGADREKLSWMVSIPPGIARSFRDDITVTVVWYDDPEHSPSDVDAAQVAHAKAKL